MNKLFKRMIVCVLMVCLLSALMVPAAATAVAADPYVIDFEIDKNEDLKWYPDATTEYTFAGTNFGYAIKGNGNTSWLAAFNNYYADGTINFSFPHTVVTEENAASYGLDSTYVGYVASALTYKSHENNPSQFGSYAYNNTSSTKEWTGLNLTSYYADGWNAVILRAPEAGTYDVTLEYSNTKATRASNAFLLPYTDALKAQVASEPAAFNTAITKMVAEKTESDNYVGTFGGWVQNPATGLICELGEHTVGMEDEYLLVVSVEESRCAYIQNVTFTPAEEEIIVPGAVVRNYVIAGTSAPSTLNKTGVTPEIEALYDAGTIDWSFLGTTSIGDTALGYNKTMYDTASGTIGYEAYKLRSPGEGVYDISFTTVKPAAAKTQIWTKVYMAEYTEGMDPASVITAANYIGSHQPKGDDDVVAYATQTYPVGEFEFGPADKEYILVMKVDTDNFASASQTVHTYMSSFVIEAQNAAPTFVPKAYIGTEPYATVAAAAAAAQSGEVVKLAMDFTGNIDLNAGVALDLNGYTWTVTNATTTNANEYIMDSAGTGKLVTKNIALFGSNANVLPLATAANTYTMADYDLIAENATGSVSNIETSPSNAAATRFWFKLSLDDPAAYDLIASGDSGLTIGVQLDWGAAEGLDVTFDNGEGAAQFAADWAAAAKTNSNIWLYVDITGVSDLTSNLTVKPVLKVNGQSSLYTGSLVYEVA